jgi:superfamily II DNA/RNA helicase
MVVTDVAARGIDIPLLDCVVNCSFPPKPKLFVHRAGRAGRAGRPGRAFSLVGPDEVRHRTLLSMCACMRLHVRMCMSAYDASDTCVSE